MQFVQTLAALITSGVSFSFKLAAAGENIQLDIVPSGKSNKTGVALPAKSLIGTAKEIDDALAEFLPKYATSTTKINEVLANADAELEAAERKATEAARKAVEEKAKSKTATKPGGKATSSTPAKRNLSAGMLEDGGAGSEEEEEEEGTTLDTTSSPAPAPAAASPAAAPAEPGALNSTLF
jgi:PRTRC genetic system protein E